MGSTDFVMDIANGQVHRPVLVVACTNRDRGLIATQNDGDDHSAMCVWVFGDGVL